VAQAYSYAELIEIAAGFPRMRVASETHKEQLYWYGNLAITDMSVRCFAFAEDEWTYTFTASSDRVDLPTTNVDGDYAKIQAVDPPSLRLKNDELILETPSWLDENYPKWRSADAQTGKPQFVAFVGRKMLFYPWPSSDFVDDGPLLYMRGWKELQGFVATAAEVADGLVLDTATPDFEPAANDAFIQGTVRHAYERRGFDDWKDKEILFNDKLNQLASKAEVSVGSGRNQTPRYHLFPSDGNRWPR